MPKLLNVSLAFPVAPSKAGQRRLSVNPAHSSCLRLFSHRSGRRSRLITKAGPLSKSCQEGLAMHQCGAEPGAGFGMRGRRIETHVNIDIQFLIGIR